MGASSTAVKNFRRAPEPPYRIAAGLLAIDRRRIAPLLVLLAAPSLVEESVVQPDESLAVCLALAREVIALGVIGLIGATWIGRLRRSNTPVSFGSFLRSIVAGLVVWALCTVPLKLPFLPLPAGMDLLGLIAAVPAAIIAWRYMFTAAPILLGVRGLNNILVFSRSFTREDPLLPARVLVPALGFKSLLMGLVFASAPDGRTPFVAYGGALLSGLGVLLGTYIALGHLIDRLPEKWWNELTLDPYRQSRTTTLIVQGREFIARLMTLRVGALVLGIGVLVWGGNMARLAEAPPAPTIEVESTVAADNFAVVTVRLEDRAFSFRGFRPVAFALAGESGFTISPYPQKAVIEGSTRDVRFFFPRDRAEVRLTLTFSTDRSAEELQKLEDLYLWHRHARVMKITAALPPAAPNPSPERGSAPPPPSQP